jgi:intracellular septation protein
MSDTPASNSARHGATQLAMDLGPIAVFVVAFNVLQRIESLEDNAVYIATGLFIAATLVAIAWAKFKTGRVPPVLVVTGVLVVIFGGLTILLHEPSLVQIKATVVYAFYVAAILGSLAFGQNVWRLLFRHLFTLPDRIWTILALRWAGFFAFMGGLNEVLRHYFNYENGNFDVWLNTRPLVAFPLLLLFTALNTPLVLKHHVEDTPPATDGAE